MAFLRIEKKKSGTYLRVVHNRRVSGKVRQETLFTLGKKEDYKDEELRNIGKKLYELGGGNILKLIGGSTKELGRYNYGFYQLYSKIFKHYKLDKLLSRIKRNKKQLELKLVDAVMLMLLERLNDPASKRRNFFNQEEYIGLKPIKLHQLYRVLDYLADNQDKIQDYIYHTGRNLFNQKLDLVFYDVTTFYFDSEKESGLMQKGFGKDGKTGKSQVVFGLLIDRDKQPIAYQTYKGNFYEGHTFPDAIDKLKKRYSIDKIVVVADRGMLSRNNLDYVCSNDGYEYIVGERLRSLPYEVKSFLLNKRNYNRTWTYNKGKHKIAIDYTTIEYQGRRIICTYSIHRAKKDKYEREKKLEKSKYLLKNPSQIKNKARRYFLREVGSKEYKLDDLKIANDAQYDGFIAISTNKEDISEEEVLDHYKHLYRIEHTFRTFKSHLEIRPMFHWTNKRIEGHICLCYIAYTMLNYVLNKLKINNIFMSEDELQRTLSKMQLSLVEQDKKNYYLRSKSTKNTEILSNIFNLKKMPDIFPKSTINKYL